MKQNNSRGILFVFLFLGVLSTGSILLLRCSKTENVQSNEIRNNVTKIAVKQIRIVGQWLNEGKRGTLVRDFCREYEFKNQEVLVDLKFPEEIMSNHADRESNVDFVVNQITKSSPDWDIIRLNNQVHAIAKYTGDSLWARKYLVDFSQYPEFTRNTLPQLLSVQVKKDWGGIIPGPFIEGSYWALWTNKNVTKKLGINIKKSGMSIDEFISYLKTVNNYNKRYPQDYIIPIHEAGDWKTAFSFVFQLYASALNNNEELFNVKVTNNKIVAWHKTLKTLEDISNLNPFDKNWKDAKWDESNKDILYEKCLFYINGSWMYNIWEAKDATSTNNIYPAEFPIFNSINLYPSAYFITWGVLKNSPNCNEAVKMLLAMNTPEVADLWVRYTKCPSGIKSRMSGLAFGTDQFETFSKHIQEQYSENVYNYTEDLAQYINGNTNADMTFYREVLTGNLTADEAIAKMKFKIQNH